MRQEWGILPGLICTAALFGLCDEVEVARKGKETQITKYYGKLVKFDRDKLEFRHHKGKRITWNAQQYAMVIAINDRITPPEQRPPPPWPRSPVWEESKDRIPSQPSADTATTNLRWCKGRGVDRLWFKSRKPPRVVGRIVKIDNGVMKFRVRGKQVPTNYTLDELNDIELGVCE